jgi:hypothetical protein
MDRNLVEQIQLIASPDDWRWVSRSVERTHDCRAN